MRKYKVKVSRVYGNGYSYNLTNQHDAERLCQTLNELENAVQLHKNIEEQFDKITKQIIQVNMTLQILNDEVKRLTGDFNDLKGGK